MNKTKKIALTTPSGFLAFGFGSGLAPAAPGTFGTLMAIPLYMALQTLPPLLYLAMVVAAFIGGVWICGRAGEALGVHDHGGIVWDEFVGFWLTMWLVPFEWFWVLAGFFLFRLFDIVKPFPIGWIDKKISGGFGVMIDDVVAGLYAWLVLMAMGYFL